MDNYDEWTKDVSAIKRESEQTPLAWCPAKRGAERWEPIWKTLHTINLIFLVCGLILLLLGVFAGVHATFASADRPVEQAVVAQPASKNITAATSKVMSGDEADLRNRYEGWKAAWERADLEAFMSYYAPEAVIVPGNHERYGVATLRERRSRQFPVERNIHITDLSTPNLDIRGSSATITVTKRYDSSLSHYQGNKTMVWQKRNDT